MDNKLVSLLVVFLVATITGSYLAGSSVDSDVVYGDVHQVTEEVESEVVVSYQNYTDAVFVGDVFLGRNVESLMDANGLDYPFKNLDRVSTSSALIINFESAVNPNHERTPDFTFSFSTKPDYFASMINYGVTHLSLANNHAFDFAQDGFDLANLYAIENSLETLGHPYRLDDSDVSYFYIGDKLVKILPLNFIYNKYGQDELEDFIRRHDTADLLITYVHWGDEYQPLHSDGQEYLAELMVRSGVDLIVGHHPHVIQDVGVVAGVPVFYSLGNFVFDQYFSEEVQTGLVLSLTNQSDNWVLGLQAVSSLDQKSSPRFMNNEENQAFLNELSEKSHPEIGLQISSGQIVF